MPNSEEYTVVWAGLHLELDHTEIVQAEAGVHPLIEQASTVGLEYWFDTFASHPSGEPIFSLLIGKKLDLLGYKEGRTQFRITVEAIRETLSRVDLSLKQVNVIHDAALHVLLRIEE